MEHFLYMKNCFLAFEEKFFTRMDKASIKNVSDKFLYRNVQCLY